MADYTNQDPNKRISKEGKTYADLQTLADQQAYGEEPMMPGNMDSDKMVPVYTKDTHYVIELEAPFFDQQTGERLTKPNKHFFSIQEFKEREKRDGFNGFQVKVIHDPIKERTKKSRSVTDRK